MTKLMPSLLWRTAVGALVASAWLTSSSPIHAEKVGVAAAVNPDAFSSLSGAPQGQLKIGKSIFYNEKIRTTGSGLVQVLLLDGSTFTVGPGSDLVIDRFVYDPKKQTGEIVATFGKGAIRFVGGKISKNVDGVRVETPAGSLAVRGGIFQAQINGSRGIFSFIFGEEMTLGRAYRVFETGYTIDTTSGTPTVRPTTPADTNAIMVALTKGGSRGLGTGSGDGQGEGGPQQTVSTYSDASSQLIGDATATQIQDEVQKQLNSETQQVAQETTKETSTPSSTSNEPPGNNEPPPTKTTEFNGYAAGLVASTQPVPFNNVVTTESPDDLFLVHDGELKSAHVALRDQGNDGATSHYDFDFSSEESENWVATVFKDNGTPYSQSSATGKVIDGAAAGLTREFPDTFGQVAQTDPAPPICNKCEFLKWGAFGTEVRFSDGGESTPYVDRINGWWVAGDLTSPTEIDKLAALDATATYRGHALGSVLNNGERYDAAGNLLVNWEFAQRKGDLTISNFDGQTFGTGKHGLTQVPSGANQFSGALSGGDGLTGKANGSFVRGPVSPAQGVIGNWNVGRNGYTATGIFAGSGVPVKGN